MPNIFSMNRLIKIMTVALFFSSTAPAAWGCDVCGCPSGQYLGILPQFHRHFVGLRWNYRTFRSFHHESAEPSREHFHTAELWGRFYPTRRLQLFAFVPFSHFRQHKDVDEVVTTAGLGDISVMANYLVFDTGDSLYTNWKHTLSVGTGVKVPTGRFRDVANGRTINPNMQLGTGSVDFSFSAIYTLRSGRFGVNTELGYRLNTPNVQGYRFGHRANVALRGFLWQRLGSSGLSILPQAGVLAETAGIDRKRGVAQAFTGGNLLATSVGCDVYFRRFMLGASWQMPLASSLGDGNVSAGNRCTVQLVAMF